jgi:hypothetical protein
MNEMALVSTLTAMLPVKSCNRRASYNRYMSAPVILLQHSRSLLCLLCPELPSSYRVPRSSTHVFHVLYSHYSFIRLCFLYVFFLRINIQPSLFPFPLYLSVFCFYYFSPFSSLSHFCSILNQLLHPAKACSLVHCIHPFPSLSSY